ncbi:MAG: tetratricopeptide repeat protein [Planctomycetota bacterium]
MRKERLAPFLIMLGLTVAVIASYYPALANDFINYDDNRYVTENPVVQAGITWEGFCWAFGVGHVANWHPLTWLSHMLDCQIYGLNPQGHHLSNLLLHIINVLLLFISLRRLTGAVWPSALVAALLALHPVNVESVAWVSERKNLLCSAFWLLTMWAYAGYAKHPSLGRYLPVALFLALGLMAKPMLVTLPFALLLLDYWPLGRTGPQPPAASTSRVSRRAVLRMVKEKIPLFVMVIASCIVTIQAQGGAVATLAERPLDVRVANAVVSYVVYMEKVFWPHALAVFYPYPTQTPWWRILTAALVLAVISVVVAWRRKEQPFLVTGWLWYLGTLVPVIGIVQVGDQALADRYLYVPLIGLFILVAWSIDDLVPGRLPHRSAVLAALSLSLLGALGVRTWHQVRDWRDSSTLFRRTLEVTTDNALAHNNLAGALVDEGRHAEARAHYEAAIRIDPPATHLKKQARFNLAATLAELGEGDLAIRHYREVLRDYPQDVEARSNLGVVLAGQGRNEEALQELKEAIRLAPDHAESQYNLGLLLAGQGRLAEATLHFRRAVESQPTDARFLNNLGTALAQQGRLDEAIRYLSRAVEIDPDHTSARRNLALVIQARQRQQK